MGNVRLDDVFNAVGQIEKRGVLHVVEVLLPAWDDGAIEGGQFYQDGSYMGIPVSIHDDQRPDIIRLRVQYDFSKEPEKELRRYSIGHLRDPLMMEMAGIIYGQGFDDPVEFSFNSRDGALEVAWRIKLLLKRKGQFVEMFEKDAIGDDDG